MGIALGNNGPYDGKQWDKDKVFFFSSLHAVFLIQLLLKIFKKKEILCSVVSKNCRINIVNIVNCEIKTKSQKICSSKNIKSNLFLFA